MEKHKDNDTRVKPKRRLVKALVFALWVAILLAFFSCVPEPVSPTKVGHGYEGVWIEVTGETETYDLNISSTQGYYVLGFVSGRRTILEVPGGFLRNDTLVFDNGTGEYWMYLKSDTLTYSSYSNLTRAYKFTKNNF